MATRDSTLGVYLHLARASHLRLQPMVRDKLLVLAAVEADAMGLAAISALCRHKVLAHNGRHLVRRWPTLAAALADERFQSYLKQLRRRYSREKTEHMLDSLGVELGRERELYASDLEYAAALLDTEPAAIGDILARDPSHLAPAARRWPAERAQATSDVLPRGAVPFSSADCGKSGRSPNRRAVARVSHVLVVWGPYVLGVTILAAWAALAGP